jgi:hypothetical protein
LFCLLGSNANLPPIEAPNVEHVLYPTGVSFGRVAGTLQT